MDKPSSRALAVARGLERTRRAIEVEATPGYLRVATTGMFYWISLDGARLFKGERRESATELQHGFIEAMARAGAHG